MAVTAIAVPVSADATVTPELYVTAPDRGRIESRPAGIARSADCHAEFAGAGPVTLTLRAGPRGFVPDWSACVTNADGRCANPSFSCDSEAAGRCELELSGRLRLSLAWRAATPPRVALDSPPQRAGPATAFTARARDNSHAVSAVRFLVDGRLVVTNTEPPFRTRLPAGRYRHGTHGLTAEAFDAAGSSSVTRAHRFDVDVRARAAFLAPTPGEGAHFNRAAFLAPTPGDGAHLNRAAFLAPTPGDGAHLNRVPSFAFKTEADIPAGGVVCRILSRGGPVLSTTPCSSPHVPQAGSDGPYTVQLRASDDVGNTSVTRAGSRSTAAGQGWPSPGPRPSPCSARASRRDTGPPTRPRRRAS